MCKEAFVVLENHRFEATIGDQTIVVETGKLAQQAGGAVTVRCGDTMLFTATTMSRSTREGIDFFPLTVDFEARMYAAGRIPGSFFRREGRPGENAILIARLTDRPLRPLFPKGMRNEVQVVTYALSQDQDHQSDILNIIAASAALTISDIPFDGPVGAVRVGYIDGEYVFNPTFPQMANSTLDLRMAGTADALLMVEAGSTEVSEEVMLEAIQRGHEAMQDVIRMQTEMRDALGKEKRAYQVAERPEGVREAVREALGDRLRDAVYNTIIKAERSDAFDQLRDELAESFAETWDAKDIGAAFEDEMRTLVRDRIIREGIRPDGRDPATIRSLSAEVGLLPRTHGSGLFTRGETQALSICTLGTPRDEQMLDDLSPDENKRYMHHYNFPPFSTGETGRIGGTNRREVGHGVLGERALLPMLPPPEVFPYTIRVVSEVLSSNGSTSQASICGSTLALMDAGVPIKAPVAGIAMGLVIDEESRAYQVLTDIQGMEDHLGDMDFKVAGTREGITALQMDIKVKGISRQIMTEALAQAREARLQILNVIEACISEPHADLSPYAPRMTTIQIDPEKIGMVIGPGGKMIRSIQDQTGVKIDIEDDGTVFIAAADGAAAAEARRRVESLVEEAEVGKVYTGRVVRTTDFGAFVEFLPGQDGLVHISQLDSHRVPSVEDVVRVGDEIMVMVIDIDGDGRVRLSRQAVLENWTAEEARERDQANRRGRSGDRSGGRSGDRSGGRSGGSRRSSR
ncbi:MAG: polyribonucleotide nucleotidyltransferase [Anaerolineae bacterium]|nr:polyribonucleotide nucleotidyltransferase [Anaerolineae bacterium]